MNETLKSIFYGRGGFCGMVDEIERRLSALEAAAPQPAAPQGREWNVYDGKREVWWCMKSGEVIKLKARNLSHGDLWLPVLSPDEPAPEGPEQETK